MTTPGTSSDSQEPKKTLVVFNQDSTSLAVCTKTGFKLFDLNSIETLHQYYSDPMEDTYIVERLFSCSLVAVVSTSAPRTLKVCHCKKATEICSISYTSPILAVRINRDRLVVCMEDCLRIHNLKDMVAIHTISDTPPNPQGICALSINTENSYIAYPGSSTVGNVQIFDGVNLSQKTVISAHDSPLAAIAFTPTGTRIATASERGTVIRLFSVVDGSKLYEFRRGVKRCVAISSLVFSTCGGFLGCSSNTETVHVFKVDEEKESPRGNTDDSGWMGYLTNYLPTQVTDVFTQGRAFATAYLPVQGIKNVLSIAVIEKQLRLLVATEDGTLYIYDIPNKGGDLVLHKQHQLDEANDDGNTSSSIEQGILGSYAGILKGNPSGELSDSDRIRELVEATQSPLEGAFQLTDDQEYPPLTHNSD